jgi:hypothetical protein
MGWIWDPEKTYPGRRGKKASDPGSGSASLLRHSVVDSKFYFSRSRSKFGSGSSINFGFGSVFSINFGSRRFMKNTYLNLAKKINF